MEDDYSIVHDWGMLPDHIRWGKTHGVVIDREERVHIAHTSCPESTCKDAVVVFDRDGRFLYSWGDQFVGHAHGLVLVELSDGDEFLYLVDDEKGIFKCSLNGEVLQHIGKPSFFDEEEIPFGPANVAVAPSGDLYLVEGYGSSHVLHFAADGRLLNRFGGRGEEDEHTKWAHGVFIAEVEG